MKLSIKDLVSVGVDNTIDRIGDNSKFNRAKSWANSQIKLAKFKNIVRPDFLTQYKLLKEPSFRLGFFILKVKLALIKLR